MLKKFLKVHKCALFERPKPPKQASVDGEEGLSTALKIVHVGGIVECYYMAMPAARIMEKYPSFLLARPQVFWRPWDSVVRLYEILIPGEKFFVIPRRTVRKLRRRISKPSKENSGNSFMSQSSNDVSAETISQHRDGFSSDGSSTSSSANRKKSWCKKHVTFAGVDIMHKKVGASMAEKKSKERDNSRKSSNPQCRGEKRRVQNVVTWQPSLTAINESPGNDDS